MIRKSTKCQTISGIWVEQGGDKIFEVLFTFGESQGKASKLRYRINPYQFCKLPFTKSLLIHRTFPNVIGY